MATYKYEAVDAQGNTVKAFVEATTTVNALTSLMAMGYSYIRFLEVREICPCPRCGAKYSADLLIHDGRPFTCRNCGASVPVPSPPDLYDDNEPESDDVLGDSGLELGQGSSVRLASDGFDLEDEIVLGGPRKAQKSGKKDEYDAALLEGLKTATSGSHYRPSPKDLPFPAYKGGGKFIFASYAHADRLLVFPDMKWLYDRRFNIWYDEGINIGASDYHDVLAGQIDKCTVFVVFVTKNVAASEYVKCECLWALKEGRVFIPVYLEHAELPKAVQFRVPTVQAVEKYNVREQDYFRKLYNALIGHGVTET
jgi:hypothetical protein